MLQAYASPGAFRPESAGHRFHPFHGVSPQHLAALPDGAALLATLRRALAPG